MIFYEYPKIKHICNKSAANISQAKYHIRKSLSHLDHKTILQGILNKDILLK